MTRTSERLPLATVTDRPVVEGASPLPTLLSGRADTGETKVSSRKATRDAHARVITLTDEERKYVEEAPSRLGFANARELAQPDNAKDLRGKLFPSRVNREIRHWRQSGQPGGALLFRNLPTPNVNGCDTPMERVLPDSEPKPFGAEEVSLFAVGVELGQPVGYTNDYYGKVFTHIHPTKEMAKKQSGEGCAVILECHQEFSYWPDPLKKQDYLALLCLRPGASEKNRCPTTYLDLRTMPELSGDASSPEVAKLFEPHFQASISTLHTRLAKAKDPTRIHVLPQKRPVLRKGTDGDVTIDYFDVGDGFFPDSEESSAAVGQFIDRVTGSLNRAALQQGEMIVIDNWHAVHGRDSFEAAFDGTDRWLMRTNIVSASKYEELSRKGGLGAPGVIDAHEHICSEGRCVCSHTEEEARSYFKVS